MAKDVIVVVQRDALPSEKESLDILLVSTTGAYPVGTYRDVESVKAVYGPGGGLPQRKGRAQGYHPAQSGQNHVGYQPREQVQNRQL